MDRNEYSDERRPRLHSLAQGARSTHLKQIRGTLLTIGIFTLIFNTIDVFTVPMQIRTELAKNGAAAAQAPGAEAILYGVAFTVIGVGFFLGILFVVFGALVHSYPVPITIASLVLYSLTSLVCIGFSLIAVGPGSVAIVVFRIIFIVALAKAVKTAFIFQKERRLEQTVQDDDLLDELDVAEPAVRPRPAPAADFRGEHGIQVDGARPVPRLEAAAEDEPILLGDEHMQAGPPRPAPPTFATAPTSEPPAPAAPRRTRERSTELIGQEFVISLGRPWTGFIIAMLVLAGIATIGALAPGRAWIAVPIALLFMALWCLFFFTRSTARRLRFTENGIEITHPVEKLAYSEILEIFAPERRARSGKNFPIHLLCAHGYSIIPASVRADSEELYRFLRTQPFGERTVPAVPPVLRDFLKQQLTVHGPADIYVYRPRVSLRSTEAAGSGEWICLSLVPAGLALIAIGAVAGREAAVWIGIGVAMIVLGMLLYVLALLRRKLPRATVKNWQKAALIIGPDGLALVQGDVTGELRWRELQGVTTSKGVPSFGLATSYNQAKFPGITLAVAGATITIADIYHWPLSHARDRIEEHWQGR
jgi:hypothetical protein